MPETSARLRVAPPGPAEADTGRSSLLARAARTLSFRSIGAIYIFLALFAIFSIWVPDTFVSWDTWKAVIATQAVTAILAIGLILALSGGAFDLAVGSELGFGAIFVAWLLADQGVGVVPAIALTILAGAGHPSPGRGGQATAALRPWRGEEGRGLNRCLQTTIQEVDRVEREDRPRGALRQWTRPCSRSTGNQRASRMGRRVNGPTYAASSMEGAR